MTDLTAITTPYGLLDRETQEALKAHGGPWEVFIGKRWEKPRSNFFDDPDPAFVIRVKPAPPKPREFWLRFDMNGIAPVVHGTPTNPVAPDGFVIHVREVLE